MKEAKDNPEDARRTRIIEGARSVFLAYGYSRATMDDIARAVEISRPAIYLLFRNKADIFRAVTRAMLEQSHQAAREALQEDLRLGERLFEALDRGLFRLFRLIEESPHGEELVDVNHNIASDLVADWRTSMVAGFADAIREEARSRGVRLEDNGLSAEALAEMLFDILEGLKAHGLCGTQAAQSARQFITLIELALAPR
ncbi:helix-turn-helix domain-containing protein [Chelativorans sp. M5D2P16]|uniref:TetR/AcrR family transcriptional regulator n=1 Tax=Chelativorans sp. M5D2P16 TaxID=3095678 RepID=UPI002ACA7B7F|nr:helix-turn-helix domain-containing protein [Chelativorans sp. M5D2P16]MDZ5699200.1 helix-turn-helix domain-containing protein [Chelativorans sp. M5D2P16]